MFGKLLDTRCDEKPCLTLISAPDPHALDEVWSGIPGGAGAAKWPIVDEHGRQAWALVLFQEAEDLDLMTDPRVMMRLRNIIEDHRQILLEQAPAAP